MCYSDVTLHIYIPTVDPHVFVNPHYIPTFTRGINRSFVAPSLATELIKVKIPCKKEKQQNELATRGTS